MKNFGLKSIKLNYFLGQTNLKKDLLYFNKLYFDEKELDWCKDEVSSLGKTLLGEREFKEIFYHRQNELDFLQEKDLLRSFNSDSLRLAVYEKELKPFTDYYDKNNRNSFFINQDDRLLVKSVWEEKNSILSGITNNSTTIFKNHLYSEIINAISDFDVVPIFDLFVPEKELRIGKEYKILEIVLNKFPVIDENVSWEQLIEFRSDPMSMKKFLALRNWMIDISKGNYNSKEISEKFDYLFSEYSFHLKQHKINSTMGSIKTFAVTSSEILEDLVRIKWSKAVKAVFELFEKNTRLTKIESNAPGKEIGYVYDVKQKFQKK